MRKIIRGKVLLFTISMMLVLAQLGMVVPSSATSAGDCTYTYNSASSYVDNYIKNSFVAGDYYEVLVTTPLNRSIRYKMKSVINGLGKVTSYMNRCYLVDGTGTYTIQFRHRQGTSVKFDVYKTYTVSKSTASPNKYSVSGSEVEIYYASAMTLTAQNLVAGKKNTYDKAKSIYDWVSVNVVYDLPKSTSVGKTADNRELWSWGASNTYFTKYGICSDYSCLVAAFCRANGIQAKVVTGYIKKANGTLSVYHAWNEIYIPEQSKWIKCDATNAWIMKKSYFDNDEFKNYQTTIDFDYAN